MAIYRFYLLSDDQDHHTVSPPFELPSDAEALIKAGNLLKDYARSIGVEIWEGSRLIQRITRT